MCFASVDTPLENMLVNIGNTAASVENTGTTKDVNSAFCNYRDGVVEGDVLEINCVSDISGRYVRVQALNINDDLNLYEIQVFGWP